MALLERVFDSRPLMLLATAALAGGVFLGVHAGGRGSRAVGLSLEEEMARGRRLDGQLHALRPRLDAKYHIIEEVIAGRMALLEAAAHFRALDHQPPAFDWDAFYSSYPGPSEEERHCQEVTKYAACQLQDD